MTGGAGVLLAPLREEHLDAVLAIERASSSQPWTIGIFRDELRGTEGGSADRVYRVARAADDGRVLGFCGLLLHPDEAHITNIAVDPAVRRRRIGELLLLDAVHSAIERGAEAMTLEVRVGNAPARALYQRFGFAPAGIRPRYYTDNGEDALVLWLHDLRGPEVAARLTALATTDEGSGVVA